MDSEFYQTYKKAYQEAEDVARQLFMRFLHDWEHSDGTQTVDDLRELVTKTVVSLLHDRVGVSVSKIQTIVNSSASMWLSEVALKQMLFFLPKMGKGKEVINMYQAIQLRFNHNGHGDEIATDVMRLGKEFTEATQQRDFNRITGIFQQVSTASLAEEETRKKFI